MHRIALASETDFDGWRQAARRLALAGIAPEETLWTASAAGELFGGETVPPAPAGAIFSVPRAFVELAETAILHKDPERFALLYALLCRLRIRHDALADSVDPLVVRLQGMAKAVRRDIHKMHAFVRFRRVEAAEPEWFVAWFEPEHHIVEAAAPFFQRRFATMRWSILTPERSAHWDGTSLALSEGVPRSEAPTEDALEDLWRSYYASIFNPARLKVDAMRAEMPKKYWRNLPEAGLIQPLVREAEKRSQEMVASAATPANPKPQRHAAAEAPPPAEAGSIEALRTAARECRRCPLWAPATQTVFGEGPDRAEIVFVGEQPGDQEDLAGRPFVGPAGQLLDKALVEAGVDRRIVYVTNAVKHFKFEPRGKRRIHQKPNGGEVQACRWWLTQELGILRPRLVVALGVTALTSLLGRTTSLSAVRGTELQTDGGAPLLATIHPSFLLRLPDPEAKEREYAHFIQDLRKVAELARA